MQRSMDTLGGPTLEPRIMLKQQRRVIGKHLARLRVRARRLFRCTFAPAPSSLAMLARSSSFACSGSTSMPHSGRSVPSTATGLPPLTSCPFKSSA